MTPIDQLDDRTILENLMACRRRRDSDLQSIPWAVHTVLEPQTYVAFLRLEELGVATKSKDAFNPPAKDFVVWTIDYNKAAEILKQLANKMKEHPTPENPG